MKHLNTTKVVATFILLFSANVFAHDKDAANCLTKNCCAEMNSENTSNQMPSHQQKRMTRTGLSEHLRNSL